MDINNKKCRTLVSNIAPSKILLDYMATHSRLANGEFNGPRGKDQKKSRLEEVRVMLKEYGPDKTIAQWEHVVDVTLLPGKRVFISEALIPMTKKLLSAARELKTNGKCEFTWPSRGNILIRKQEGQPAIVLNSLQQVLDLMDE